MDIPRRPLLTVVLLIAAPLAHAQPAALSATERQKRIDTEKELQSLAIVERKLMVPMRDGVRLATDVYRPRNAHPVPIACARHTTSTSGTSVTACRPT
jgi:predicted acyl esterase